MPRSSPFWMLILSLSTITSTVHAAEMCPDTTLGPPPDGTPATQSPNDDSSATADDERVFIESDEATVSVNGDAALQGNVLVTQGDREVRADDVHYNSTKESFEFKGEIQYTDPLVSVKGTTGSYSAAEGANFRSAEFELRERSARGAADEMRLTPGGVIQLDGVSFTTCPITDQAWRLRADEIVLDTNSRLGTGRSTRVEFLGVPILYMPWMSFPLGTQRKSGFLFPSIGHSTRSGLQFSAPYYWNIAPNADLTFEPVYYGRRGIDLAGEVRYLTHRQRGGLEVNYLPEDDVAGDSRSRFHLDHVAQLPRGFRFTVDATKVSDTEYFEDFAQGPEGTSVAFVERLARFSFRDENWRFSGEFQEFQTIDRELADVDRPYARLPRIVAGADFGWGPGERLRYGFDSEVVNFDRDIGVTGWRLDVMPTAELDLGGAGYFVRPGIAWRHTQYELEDLPAGSDTSPSRSLPIASLDAGLVFERETGTRHKRLHTLEPRVLYLNIPFHDQDELPIFDTAVPDLNLVQLFRTNRYVGADRVSDANQVSVGVTTRLFDAESGTQYLSATLGQTYYLDPPRVLLPDEPTRNGERSDVVAQLALTAYRNWNADFGLQWNPGESQSERAEVNLQYQPGDEQVINVGYRFQRDRLEQAEVSSAWPVGERWNLFGRFVHSLRDDTALERFVGVEYKACCWRVRFLGRRFVSSRTGEQDTGYYLQLELTGLASVGSAADAFLAGAIRGYTRNATRP